jgi:NAD(P)-dependent dehydrogenase (short-subunit alcohol dehydrogenase family)
MHNQDLAGKTTLVTGAGRGIGAAIARRLAAFGASTIVCGRTLPNLEQTCHDITSAGGQCRPITCDVTDWNSVAAVAAQVQQIFGGLNILVNNAGIGGPAGPLHSLPPHEWDAIMNTNLRGVFYCIRAFVPLMIAAGGGGAAPDARFGRRGDGGGHIINISSIAGKNPVPNRAAYSASKWGLNGLTYTAAEELRGHNIRVSVICPGSTHTDFGLHEGKSAQKMLQPDDVAHLVAMLVTQAPQSFASEIVIRPTQKP